MKRNLLILVLLATLVSCAVGLFLVYWFEYRPEEIKVLCRQEEQVNAQRPNKSRRVRSYQECLQENGIGK